MAKTLDKPTQQPNVAGSDKCNWVVRQDGVQGAVKKPIGPDKCDWVVRAQDQGANAATGGKIIRQPGADKCDWVVSAGTQAAGSPQAAKPGADKCDWVVKNRPDETSR